MDVTVAVRGRALAGPGMAFLADPLEEVPLSVVPGAAQAPQELEPPATLDLSKPRSFVFDETSRSTWRMDGGTLVKRSTSEAVWRAPAAPKAYEVGVKLQQVTRFSDASDSALQAQESVRAAEGDWAATCLVRRSFNPSGDGILDGYTVGIYPNPALDSAPSIVREHLDAYAPPKYFVQVTPQTAPLRLSAHFRLGDFSPFSERAKPHCIALDLRLVDFLEALSARLKQEGRPEDSLAVLRGFVSPYQRLVLAREGIALASFSRHQYGDGAVLIVDSNRDRRMDDLTGDGAVTIADAERLAAWVEAVQKETGLLGGIGIEAHCAGPEAPDGPTVHVDLRGWKVQWRTEE